MTIGYARVSTTDQNLDLQTDALKKYGCEKIYSEKITGSIKDRPELVKMLDQVRPGDKVVVWRLDRLGRSTKDLIELVNGLEKKGAGFSSLTENIETGTATGRMIFTIFAALAEFERNLTRERTKAGLASSRARGKVGGRKPGLSKHAIDLAKAAKSLYKDGNTIAYIMKTLKIGSKRTLYKYLRHENVKIGNDTSITEN